MALRLLSVQEFDDQLVLRWRAWVDADRLFGSPFFHPEFTLAVADVRDDVRVAVFEADGHPQAVFPLQVRDGVARPVGGRLSDFHGAIGPASDRCDILDVLRLAGASSFEFDNLAVWNSTWEPHILNYDSSLSIDVHEGWEGFVRGREAAGSQLIPQMARKERKLERQLGPLRFEWHASEPEAFHRVLEWKRRQYQATQVTDVFQFEWIIALLRNLCASRSLDLSGVLSVLYAGDTPVATHLGMRSRDTLHCWFPVYATEYARSSPGALLFLKLIEHATDHGISQIDLGRESEWKRRFSTTSRQVAEGLVERRPLRRAARRAWRRTKAWIKQTPFHSLARLPGKWLYQLRDPDKFE